MPKSSLSPYKGIVRLYDANRCIVLPTRLYKRQAVGEMLAITVLRPQMGVEFIKRLARSLPLDIPRTTSLEWFAKAMGYHTWIHALQHRTENGKVILSLRQAPPDLKVCAIDWSVTSETLTVTGILPDQTLYHTAY